MSCRRLNGFRKQQLSFNPGKIYQVKSDRSAAGSKFSTNHEKQMAGLMNPDLFQKFHD
jgi:hypothetical protein